MSLLGWLLLGPVVGPARAVTWSLDAVRRVTDEELTDDAPVKQALLELQMRLELGEIDADEYARGEAELMVRLREIREWRERLGRAPAAGPVRVARVRPADE